MGIYLNTDQIEKSPEIQSWLNQFASSNIPIAKDILRHICFIPRDEYSTFLLNKLAEYSQLPHTAIYSVRKFDHMPSCLWEETGVTISRPASALGSEDFITSIIAVANKKWNNCFLDSPDLLTLREKRIRNILLVDDAIGSGKRISSFIKLMTNNKTFMSWWNGGFITIHILSFACTYQAKELIIKNTPGSNHGKRKKRVGEKIKFSSEIIYDSYNLHHRWGSNCDSILELCKSIKKIGFPLGYGNTMSNLVFFHSVPNNIPGILFHKTKKWNPLFENRSFPLWLKKLLENPKCLGIKTRTVSRLKISDSSYEILASIKKGVRTCAALARRIDSNEQNIKQIVNQAITLGLVSPSMRITKAGQDYLLKKEKGQEKKQYNYAMYIPFSWCVGQKYIQPSSQGTLKVSGQTDSADLCSVDGEGGISSLERTDAIAISSPIMGITQPHRGLGSVIPITAPEGLKE